MKNRPEFEFHKPGAVTVAGLVARASRELRQGELVASFKSIQEALELDPDSAEVWSVLAQVLRSEGKRFEAVSAIKKAMSLKDEASYHRLHLNLLIDLGDNMGFEVAFQEARSKFPKEATFFAYAVKEAIALGDIKKAESLCKEGLLLRPEDYQLNASHGNVLVRKREYLVAEKIYLDLIGRYPEEPLAYFSLACLYGINAEFGKVLELMGTCERKGFAYDSILDLKVTATFYLGNFPHTIELCEEYLRLFGEKGSILGTLKEAKLMAALSDA